jgi:hypothetical protein
MIRESNWVCLIRSIKQQEPQFPFLFSAEVVKNLTSEIEHLKSLPALDGVRALADASSTIDLAQRLGKAMANWNEWNRIFGSVGDN